jgi:hypothetical protein
MRPAWQAVAFVLAGRLGGGDRPGPGRDASRLYAHLWQADELVVVYDDARFGMHRYDQ